MTSIAFLLNALMVQSIVTILAFIRIVHGFAQPLNMSASSIVHEMTHIESVVIIATCSQRARTISRALL